MGSGEVDRGKKLVRAKRRTGLFQDVSGTYVHRVPRSAVPCVLVGKQETQPHSRSSLPKSLTFYNKNSSVMHKGQISKRRRQKSGNTSVSRPSPPSFLQEPPGPMCCVSSLCVGFTPNTVTSAHAERRQCFIASRRLSALYVVLQQ